MGLKNTNSTVNDLKATFFDVFCEHTEELAALIEVLANDPNVDAMKIESLIFQRIIMLNKTAGNIKGLMSNVDDLNLVKGSGLKTSKVNSVSHVVEEQKVADSSPVKESQVVASSVPAQIPTTAPQVVPTTVPQQVPTTAPQVATTAPQAVPTTAPEQVPTTAPQQVIPTTAPKPIPASVPQTTPSVIPTTAPKKSLTQMLTEKVSSPVPVQNRRLTFVKNSDNKVKAILVNDGQFQKLRASCVVQAKILDFGITVGGGAAPTKEKIEGLMKKASALYKEGKISEAQALYAEISSLNKQMKKDDAKVLTKVA